MTTSEEVDAICKDVEQLLTEEACSDGDDEKRAFIEQAFKRASRLFEIAPDNYATYHVHGVLWYHHPDKSTSRSQSIKDHLHRAVSMEPLNCQFSVQYLGYIYFDEENYAEALKWFERTDEEYFEENDMRWRWLKARELALVCRGRIRRKIDLDAVRSLAGEYVRAEREDQNAPLPIEISEFASDAIENCIVNCDEFVRIVVSMLQELEAAFLIERYRLNRKSKKGTAYPG